MVGKFDVSHCGDCGSCEGCLVYEDNFSDGSLGVFVEEVGAWEDEAGADGLTTVNEEAEIIYRGDIVPTVNLWRMQVDPHKDASDVAENVINWRLIFGRVDSSNYWYAEFTEITEESIVTTIQGKIVEISSGSPTTHKEFSFSVFGIPGWSTNPLIVCFQNNVIKAFILAHEYYTLTYEVDAPIGGEFGLGTGLFTNINKAIFNDFSLAIDSAGEGNCEDCPVNEFLCDTGCSEEEPPPTNFQVEISGIINHDVFNVNCTNCIKANGTYVLQPGASCFWIANVPGIGPAHPLFGSPTACNAVASLFLFIEDIGGGNRKLTVQVHTDSGVHLITRFELIQAGPFVCKDMDGLNIPRVSGGLCGPDNPPISNPAPTCLVTAL